MTVIRKIGKVEALSPGGGGVGVSEVTSKVWSYLGECCPDIENFSLEHSNTFGQVALANMTSHCCNITALSLSHVSGIDNNSVSMIAGLLNLTDIHISFSSATEDGFVELFENSLKLRNVSIKYSSNLSNVRVVAISTLSSLRSLNINGCKKVTDAMVRST